jgi:hypothetical protein
MLLGIQRDLIPVNAIIGFLKRDRRWPSPLYQSGYRLEMIEQPISVAGVGQAEIDVICLKRSGHAILWECKSGHTVNEKQARVYAAVTVEDVQRTGNITFPQPAKASVEAAYCCLERDGEKVVAALSTCAPGIPVVALGSKAILISGQFRDANLTTTFVTGVELPPLEEVPRFLRANTQTPKASIARDLLATIVSFLQRQTRKVAIRQIMEETFPDWVCMGTDLRRHLTATAKEALTEACAAELKEYARVSHPKNLGGEPIIEWTIDILGQDASARTRLYQKLTRQAELFIERTAEGKAFDPAKEPETAWLPGFEPE